MEILGMQNGQILLLCLFRMGELFLFRGDKLGVGQTLILVFNKLCFSGMEVPMLVVTVTSMPGARGTGWDQGWVEAC